jgi:hypothetical protein
MEDRIVKKASGLLGDTARASTWISISRIHTLHLQPFMELIKVEDKKIKFLLKCYILSPYLFLEFVSRN